LNTRSLYLLFHHPPTPATYPLSLHDALPIYRGTTTRSADAIAEALDDRGVALRTATNRHVISLSCTCLSEDFGDVLAEVLRQARSEEHTSELQSRFDLVCRLLLEKKKTKDYK